LGTHTYSIQIRRGREEGREEGEPRTGYHGDVYPAPGGERTIHVPKDTRGEKRKEGEPRIPGERLLASERFMYRQTQEE
jgi:hypothetical protein